jgi:hypothetical protein
VCARCETFQVALGVSNQTLNKKSKMNSRHSKQEGKQIEQKTQRESNSLQEIKIRKLPKLKDDY